jgi:hypothetical protein
MHVNLQGSGARNGTAAWQGRPLCMSPIHVLLSLLEFSDMELAGNYHFYFSCINSAQLREDVCTST